MTKNFKLSFLFYTIFFGIITAYFSLSYTVIGGVGVNTVALIVLLGLSISMFIIDKDVRARTRDLFIVACCLTVFELISYFALEFDFCSVTAREGFYDYQTFLSILGLVFLIYTIFRCVVEFKGVKITPIEFILGNLPLPKKPKIKANKELTNGSLEEKPNHALKDAEIKEEIKEDELPQSETLDGQIFIEDEGDMAVEDSVSHIDETNSVENDEN